MIEQAKKTYGIVERYVMQENLLTFFKNEQSQIQWKLHIQSGNWQDGIAELENIEKVDPSKSTWVKLKTAWIQYSFIERLAKDKDERLLFMKSIYDQLQDVSQENPEDAESLLLQGLLLFSHDAVSELGLKTDDPKACLTKWLQALKRD